MANRRSRAAQHSALATGRAHDDEKEREPSSALGTLERLTFLSDGVFAIALTLLVVSLSPPDPNGDLAAELWDMRPRFVSFAVSFLVIAVFWVGHQRLFRYLV